MKRWLVFFTLIINSTGLLSQKKLNWDTASVELRPFNKAGLKDMAGKKEFQYGKLHEPALSLWDKFWNWVWFKVDQVMRARGGRAAVWSILIVLSIITTVFFVLRLTGMDKNGLFGRSTRARLKYTSSQDDIHGIPFEDAINTAAGNGNFRLATRLHYLQALKKLSDKGYIDWRIDKTNTDYLAEITGKPFSDIFTTLTFDFEYTWYGEKPVTKEQFLQISQQFQQFDKQLQ